MIILVFFLLTKNCDAFPGNYECGTHGRFEYCIDNFPGCVVGCHCYPGYYFDTESKICEPNTKLTQDYRRHMQPTAYNLHGSSGTQIAPAPPPPQLVAPSTEEPAQDGDLSDWLYNQFFKTIESQVVNKTDEEPLAAGTRRSGGGAPIEPLPTRRRRRNRRKKSKKRGKKKNRSDDEDSDEGSSSGSSSSESDSDDSKGDLGSWERFEWNRPSPNAPSEAKDAAHREIVMYSKKPKPPLPSFIFLPNMGTAFYPPIGLPAPAMPMYPMVPIPPINPAQPENCENETDKTTHAASTETHETTTTAPTTAATTTTATSAATTATSSVTTDANQDNLKALRSHNFYNKFLPKIRNKPPPRQVFKPSPLPPPVDYPMKQYHQDSDYDAMFMGDTNLLFEQGDKMDTMDSGPNFKYISELIHRDNNNSTTEASTLRNPMKQEQFFGVKPPMPRGNKKRRPIIPGRLDESTRRRFDPRKNGEDDSYYSSLGKQIAKLIRGLDSDGGREANFNIGPSKDPKPEHPIFSESSYAARNYWERFVRSPLSLRLKNFTEYEDLIASNENLFELENQVQEATSAPILSWQELENVINAMGTIRKQHDRALKNNNDKVSNASLNVNLLPQYTARRSFAYHRPDIKIENITINTAFDDVIETLTRSSRNKKAGKKVFKEAVKEPFKTASKNDLSNSLPRSIPLNTNVNNNKLRSFVSTLKPIFITTLMKSKKHDVQHNDNNKIDYFNEIGNFKPHVISVGGETTFVKSKKFFFDSGTNYPYESWVIE